MLQHHESAVVVKLRQGFTIHALGFFGIPLDKAGAISHFAFGLCIGLALFGGEDASQIIQIRHQQVVPLAQNNAALFGGFLAPRRPRGVGRGNRTGGVVGTQVGYIGQFAAIAGVEYIEAMRAFDPFAIDERIGFEQAGVFELCKWTGHGAI